jgi:hypothetical protein
MGEYSQISPCDKLIDVANEYRPLSMLWRRVSQGSKAFQRLCFLLQRDTQRVSKLRVVKAIE